ncbi:ribbon-helix-helix protein, CopG family [Pelagicoccus sp. SDUM812003]|uniref:ribbon-helix-helix protein, CopG family n=1 Tax=Pelagicoccus sp. SDUM812003 TaxID=3041267 RepID=UPI00280CB6A5|nr:ribbon-helix-helix protein, CopG family [Pelagicoccus sp. SDUM812003]MDQ8203811.1 ribbon-helix-helix protein, CopG family [Pelagicoccus sp. SDUM812003]
METFIDVRKGDVMLSTQPLMSKADDKKSKRRNTSLRLDSEMLKALKRRAIDEETSVQRILEKLIRDYLKKT